MKLITEEQMKRLVQNAKHEGDHYPVVKLFGGSACAWLLSEYHEDSGLFFGLCDLGIGCPELGYVSKQELEEIKFPPFGLNVERETYFKATKPISGYAEDAIKHGRIVV